VSSPVLIKACLNGARVAGAHPALPVTPEDLAAAARAARKAGAGAVHFHPRDFDGHESLEPDDVARTVDAVRAACPGLPCGVTTGAWILRDTARRLEIVGSWPVLPDFASVNWSEEGAEPLARLLIDRGIGVEAGLFTLDDARAFAASPVANSCLRALIEVRERGGVHPVTLASAMDGVLAASGVAIGVLHHGFGAATWTVLDAALRLGRDIRIGLEDTFTLPDGRTARDNAELVAAAVAMAAERGREPAR
jgi:uncharacterized protein (DUF849 family)